MSGHMTRYRKELVGGQQAFRQKSTEQSTNDGCGGQETEAMGISKLQNMHKDIVIGALRVRQPSDYNKLGCSFRKRLSSPKNTSSFSNILPMRCRLIARHHKTTLIEDESLPNSIGILSLQVIS